MFRRKLKPGRSLPLKQDTLPALGIHDAGHEEGRLNMGFQAEGLSFSINSLV